MAKTFACPNCKYEIPEKYIEEKIEWSDVVLFDTEEYEIPCPECEKYFTVEVKAEPEIKIK